MRTTNKILEKSAAKIKNGIATFLIDPFDPERLVTGRISWQMDEIGS